MEQQRVAASRLWRAVAQNGFEVLHARLADGVARRGIVVARQNLGGVRKRQVRLEFDLAGIVSEDCSANDSRRRDVPLLSLRPFSSPIDDCCTHHLITSSGLSPVEVDLTDSTGGVVRVVCGRPDFATLALRKAAAKSDDSVSCGEHAAVEVWGTTELNKHISSDAAPNGLHSDSPLGCESLVVIPPTIHGDFFGGSADLVRIHISRASRAQDEMEVSADGSQDSRLYAIYVAEAPKRPAKSFLDPDGLKVGQQADDCGTKSNSACFGNQYDHVETWGEGRKRESNGRVYIADFYSSNVWEIDLPEGYSYTSPQFLPCGLSFVVVGQATDPFRLGTIYCQNRPQVLFFVEVDLPWTGRCSPMAMDCSTQPLGPLGPRVRRVTKLSRDEDLSAFFTSIAPSFKDGSVEGFRVMFSAVGRAPREARVHYGCSRLCVVDINLGGGVGCRRRVWCNETPATAAPSASPESIEFQITNHRELIGEVAYPRDGDRFAGLYRTEAPPKFCWTTDGSMAFVSTFVGCTSKVVAVNMDNGEVHVPRLIFPEPFAELSEANVRLHDVSSRGSMLLEVSTPNFPATMVVCRWHGDSAAADKSHPTTLKVMAMLHASTHGDTTVLHRDCQLSANPTPNEVRALIRNNIKWRLYNERHVVIESSFPPLVKQNVLQAEEQRPLVILLHGGPHSVTPPLFSSATAYLALCGFSILAINYCGSIGFGQDELLSLPSNIGTQDVKECATTIESFLSDCGKSFSRNKVFSLGGSHGGFLTLQLMGQYPTLMAAASARNPCANIGSQLATSDIPDWAFHEGGGIADAYVGAYSLDVWQKLLMCSPICHVDNVTTPLLLALGARDCRVPPSQGLEFARLLRASYMRRNGAREDNVPQPTDSSRSSLDDLLRVVQYPEAGHPIDQPEYESDYWINTVLWFSRWSNDAS